MDFTELIDLASERVGGAVLVANDDFFAPKENLLRASAPVFIEGKYTDRGKWMDGWESRRRRTPGFDWCIVRLGLPGIVRGVVVDTSFFRGNYPEHCSLEGAVFTNLPTEQELTSDAVTWVPLLPQMPLSGDSQNPFATQYDERVTHLRLKIYPDGGVARLRVYGEVVPDWEQLKRGGYIDLAAVENGGLVLSCSDMFFGHRHNLIMPGRAANMSDGWETKRRRGPGHDWAIIKLGRPGLIHRIEVDTSHFKGNFPESCSLEACNLPDATPEQLTDLSTQWSNVLARTKLQAHTRHYFDQELHDTGVASHLRFSIFPDGGVSRLRVYGTLTKLAWLNSLTADEAVKELLQCCGSKRWATEMVTARPYATLEALLAKAGEVWRSLDHNDWLEAFRSHPKIGEKKALNKVSAQSQQWSGQEQSGVANAPQDTVDSLAALNEDYEQKFGFIFIICATGKTSDEMLSALRERLAHDREGELPIAAAEQAKITELRLKKILTSS